MTSKYPRPAASSDARSRPHRGVLAARLAWLSPFLRRRVPVVGGAPIFRRWRKFAPPALIGAALVLSGAVAGLAAGQRMASRSAHQAGACIALRMAAAFGNLDAEQQRRVRHALVTAINPDADLFAGGRPSLHETCGTGP